MTRPKKILITGSNGFVGQALLERLIRDKFAVRCILRQPNQAFNHLECVLMPTMDKSSDWSKALKDCDIVIHLAARVHVMQDHAIDPLLEFRKVNVDLTALIANEAASQGVKRFIFLSSVKVNGESTSNKPFTESQAPHPEDAYAISKWEAEETLRSVAKDTGMEVVIIRPPLIYGRGVKANFLMMMRYLLKGVPLPLGAIHNKRSLVYLDNLVDFIVSCVLHPKAANQTFLISDDRDVSTTELLRLMSKAIGKKRILITVPEKLLFFLLVIVGRRNIAERLLCSLEVDISKAKNLLGWRPTVTMEEGLKATMSSIRE